MAIAATTPRPAAPSADLRPALERVVSSLQATLAALFDDLELDPGRPQSVSRALGLDKTLAWRACRFTREVETLDALGYLPGTGAFHRLWAAAGRAGADAGRLERARAAAAELAEHIVTHAGSPQGFRRLLAGLDAERGQPRHQEDGRRQAFHGNAAIWGVQAQARLGFHAVAPNREDGSTLDLLTVGGVHALHRTRESARWPIVRYTAYGGARPPEGPEPLDERVKPGEPPLLRDFCSADLPPLRAVEANGSTVFELQDGGLGRTAAVTCLFGFLRRRAVPRHAASPDERGEHLTFLNTPAERALIDLAIHKDLGFGVPELQLCSQMESTAPIGADDAARYVLPVFERVVELSQERPMLETACLPRYPDLVRFALAQLGYEPSQFRFFRVELTHPPIPTVAVLRHRLLPD
ncbi:MAG: hypothetical protein ACYTG2_03960 [Planctomycetota bacterium]|jgi:hypothetical protein